jgi:hypothetical protein
LPVARAADAGGDCPERAGAVVVPAPVGTGLTRGGRLGRASAGTDLLGRGAWTDTSTMGAAGTAACCELVVAALPAWCGAIA